MDTITKISKDFRWEMGHRLPFHTGGCQNIHGHSYRLRVTITGYLDENGMVLDYFDLKSIIAPILDELDHAFLCDDRDDVMRGFLAEHSMKHKIVPFRTTAENLAQWLLGEIREVLKNERNIISLSVRVHETSSTYAERSVNLN